uniref:HAT C-terminal dimerisation domain-containing protein n=1 Tax=Seriola lalandi dorsalis TaxID=1841481 RepID=A0A3B4XJK6_SERLL
VWRKEKKMMSIVHFRTNGLKNSPLWREQVSAVCLICNDKIASMKRSNVKRHFDTRHATFASKYPAGDSRKKAQQQLRVWTRQGDYNSASFAGSLAIVRNGKPFTDGEYAKTFMLDVANGLFDDLPNKDKIIKRIQDMPLSARTVHDRTIMMANQVEETQVKDINTAPFFSLALDESTDVSHLSQFSVIARYAAGDTLREESLAVLPIKGSTRAEDLFKSFMEFAHEKNIPMDKLLSVCTDGAPCMVGKNKGFLALLREHENRPILSFHCILHQEALCAQMCDGQLGEVMSLVIRVINFIVARALNDRQFKTLLDEVGNNYHGLLLHSNVSWLSRGKVLSRFAACLNEIRTFFEMKGIEHPELLAGFTSSLLQSFKARFGEFREHTHLFKFITHPNECSLNTADLSYIPDVSLRDFEAGVADLKASDMWVNKFKSLNEDLERIARQKAELASKHIIAVLTMFGSTYSCEQSFSHLKNIKSNLRSRLTDESLNACMKLNLTNILVRLNNPSSHRSSVLIK